MGKLEKYGKSFKPIHALHPCLQRQITFSFRKDIKVQLGGVNNMVRLASVLGPIAWDLVSEKISLHFYIGCVETRRRKPGLDTGRKYFFPYWTRKS